jgi:hypothetical protein
MVVDLADEGSPAPLRADADDDADDDGDDDGDDGEGIMLDGRDPHAIALADLNDDNDDNER